MGIRDGFLDKVALELRSDGSKGGIQMEAKTSSKALQRGCTEFETGRKSTHLEYLESSEQGEEWWKMESERGGAWPYRGL